MVSIHIYFSNVRVTYGTQLEYTPARDAHASLPSWVWREPIRTRSGAKRSAIAVPSARNSGLDRMSNWQLGLEFASRMVRMDSAVRHGTVDFSTTILDESETNAMRRVASST